MVIVNKTLASIITLVFLGSSLAVAIEEPVQITSGEITGTLLDSGVQGFSRNPLCGGSGRGFALETTPTCYSMEGG